MRIYQAEKDAGLDSQMNEAGSSTAFVTAPVQIGDIKKYFDGMSVADLVKATDTVQSVEELLGKEQPDLALVVAILVSTGWNLNDDIFTPEEVWKARSSPLHKPINDNHDIGRILGHMVQSRVLDKSGNEIELAENEAIPSEFDLEVAGVLYKAFPELTERIDEIIAKAQKGEMFVSMEAWFPDFGYGLMDSATGEIKLIERTEDTAFLTKHLMIYGGSGKYQDYKVGRVLRDFIFGAQGFVDIPANPESVIKVAANKQVYVTAELSELLKGGVEDVDEKQIKELQVDLESKTQKVVELQKLVEDVQAKTKEYDGQIATLTEKVEELTANVTEASEKMVVVETEKTELQKQFDEVTKRAEKSESDLEGIRKVEMARERLVKLSEVKKVDDEKVALAELCEMTEETFALVLKYAGEVKTSIGDKTVDEKEKEVEQAEAVLNDAKVEDTAELKATEDTVKAKAEQYVAMANALCGCEDKENEGGE